MPLLSPGRILPSALCKRARSYRPVGHGLATPTVRARILRSHSNAADDALANWIALDRRRVVGGWSLVDRAGAQFQLRRERNGSTAAEADRADRRGSAARADKVLLSSRASGAAPRCSLAKLGSPDRVHFSRCT